MIEPNEQAVQRIQQGAIANNLGPVGRVEHFLDGGSGKQNLFGGIALMVICAAGLILFVTVGLGLGVLFYGLVIMLGLGLLSSPFMIFEGIVKLIRGELFIGFAPGGAVATYAKKAAVMPFPFATTTVKPVRRVNKHGRVRSLEAEIDNHAGKKLTLQALSASEADRFNRVLSGFPGQPTLPF